jgi:hypothetical protein
MDASSSDRSIEIAKSFETSAGIFSSYEIPYLRAAALLQKMGHHKESIGLIGKAEALTLPLREAS